jgi:hypothetical protein
VPLFGAGEAGERVLQLWYALSWIGVPPLGSASQGCAAALIRAEPEGHAATAERGEEDWRGRDYMRLRVRLGFGLAKRPAQPGPRWLRDSSPAPC